MENKRSSTKIGMDYVKKFLAMPQEEQKERLIIILDYLKENDLEKEFFVAAANILDESTIEDVKNWYNRKK